MLGGVSKGWRFDRMATLHDGSSGDVNKDFAASARHYGTPVTVCPPHSGHSKGVVKKKNHFGAQRGWPTAEHKATFEQTMATYESLATLAVPYPVILSEERIPSRQALVAWLGNYYSVPPDFAAAKVTVAHRLGTTQLDIAAATGS